MANRWGNNGTVTDFIFWGGSKITADGDCSHESKRRLLLGRKAMTNLDSILKSRRYFANKGTSIQSYGFSSSRVWMCELDYKEGWVLKNWCFWTVVLEKTLEYPLDCKITPINPKGKQPQIFIGRTNAEADAPIFWPPDAKELTHWKRLWCWERLREWGEGADKGCDGWMVSPTQWTWVWANPGDGEEQGSLVCCSSWDRKESNMT